MRVAIVSRATLYSSPGGDTMQIDHTAACLRRQGVDVDIFLTNQQINYQNYDLLHFFNIIRPADILRHINKTNKPFLVSTIFVDYQVYEKKARTGWKSILSKVMNNGQLEYAKAIARWLKNGENISSWDYLLKGHTKSIKTICEKAAMLLPNSQSEYDRLTNAYRLKPPYHIVPNGIDVALLEGPFIENKQYANAVLCVGRIEGRKNQLNLIKALNNTSYRLYIVGNASPNNKPYYEECKKQAATNIHFIPWLNTEELYELYYNAKVHVLPSYFETTGLSSLEAAAMGCNIVVTAYGDTKEYFKHYAWYCDPDDIKSISNAVDAAFSTPYHEGIKRYILANYTWEKAAKETLYAYRQVLNQNAFICNTTP